MKDSDTRALLFDMTRCGRCYGCVRACMKLHDFPGVPEEVRDLSATAYTTLIALDEDATIRNMCRHCLTPSCVSVCPVRALQKSELGPVIYDATRCMGCRYCMVACPFGVPRYEWDAVVPSVRKCDMCIDRQREGKLPACVDACPNEATVAGTRAELLAEAHRRIAEDPDEYYDHVYGEFEVGGTSVLFLTSRPVEELGFKEILGTDPIPRRTQEALGSIPRVGLTVGAALMALTWITNRRNEVMAHEARQRRSRQDAALEEDPDGNGIG